MYATPDNPAANRLGAGITEDDVSSAVSRSGYPLQTIVADHLRSQFDHIREEWSYIDSDTEQHRAIDIYARKRLITPPWDEELKVVPSVSLLIECKRSELPYVFFLSPSKLEPRDFPLVCGLPKLKLRQPKTGVIRPDFPVGEALDLGAFRFAREPNYCTSFSKVVRSGKKVELAGDEPFRGLLFPITKAMQHYEMLQAPQGPSYSKYYCDLTVGVGILDAPMVGVRVSEAANDLLYVPWVRVVRHESGEVHQRRYPEKHRSRLFAVDVIHKDFLQTYLDNEHLHEFAVSFAGLVQRHQDSLASGTGLATNDWKLVPC